MRGKRGADERTRPGDRGKMVAKEDPFVGRHEVAAIVVAFRRRGARVVKRQDFGSHESGIETECDEITAKRGNDKPHGVERFAAVDSNRPEGACAKKGDHQPSNNGENTLHCTGPGVLDLRNCAISVLCFTCETA